MAVCQLESALQKTAYMHVHEAKLRVRDIEKRGKRLWNDSVFEQVQSFDWWRMPATLTPLHGAVKAPIVFLGGGERGIYLIRGLRLPQWDTCWGTAIRSSSGAFSHR